MLSTDQSDLMETARRLVEDEPALVSSGGFGPLVRQGCGPGPRLIIGDQSEIPLFSGRGVSPLEHRMALLAEARDIVVLRQRQPEFEHYLAEVLGISGVLYLEADGASPDPVPKQILARPDLSARIAGRARRAGGLTLLSYLTTGWTWRLAAHLSGLSGQPIHVCGPTPRMARRANDKLWFTRLANTVLGRSATPPTLTAFGPAGAAGMVSYFSKRSDHVVVKVPDSAGSAGNVRLDSAQLRGLGIRGIRDFICSRLHAAGWKDTYPILVGVWDADVTGSPSVQLWVPAPGNGPPVVQGIFEQTVQGQTGTFVGAARSALPAAVQAGLARDAVRIAAVLQNAGYFGRCSFDAVLCAGGRRPRVHWIECNGRWGGVSVPLTVARRCWGSDPEGLTVVQDVWEDRRMPLPEVLRRLHGLLVRKGTRRAGVILLSPVQPRNGTSINLLAAAGSRAAAGRLAEQAFRRLSRAGP